jgi:hypothetical protein
VAEAVDALAQLLGLALEVLEGSVLEFVGQRGGLVGFQEFYSGKRLVVIA